MKIIKIDEQKIQEIIAEYYNTKPNLVFLYDDYEFVLREGDKVKHKFYYSLLEVEENK